MTHSILAQLEKISVCFNFTSSSLHPGDTLIVMVVLQFNDRHFGQLRSCVCSSGVLLNNGVEQACAALEGSGNLGFGVGKCVCLEWSIKKSF